MICSNTELSPRKTVSCLSTTWTGEPDRRLDGSGSGWSLDVRPTFVFAVFSVHTYVDLRGQLKFATLSAP